MRRRSICLRKQLKINVSSEISWKLIESNENLTVFWYETDNEGGSGGARGIDDDVEGNEGGGGGGGGGADRWFLIDVGDVDEIGDDDEGGTARGERGGRGAGRRTIGFDLYFESIWLGFNGWSFCDGDRRWRTSFIVSTKFW